MILPIRCPRCDRVSEIDVQDGWTPPSLPACGECLMEHVEVVTMVPSED